jgi:hypothetical protein
MMAATATEMLAARATGRAALNPARAGARRPMRRILPAIPVLAAQAVATSNTGKKVTLNKAGLATVVFEDGTPTPAGPPPVWALWKIREMRSLVASVRPWSPTPRNRPTGDPTDPANSGDGSGNNASHADNGFPQGTGAATGGRGKDICTIC